MTVYVLVEIHDYEHCPILGVYTTVDRAKKQLPDVAWNLNELDTWIGSRPISAWSDRTYEIAPWETDEKIDDPYTDEPTYVRSPEEIAAMSQPPRFRGGVSSIGAYSISASTYFPSSWVGVVATPAEGTPEYESMLKAIEINKAQIERYRKEHPEPTEGETDTSDWKARFDKLIKQVTEF